MVNEQARSLWFSEAAIEQLLNMVPWDAQHALASSPCISTLGRHYEAIGDLLTKADRHVVHSEADIPGDSFVNAVLAHAVLPPFAEIVKAQKADPELQTVRKYLALAPKARDPLRLPKAYRGHIEFMQIHDDAIFYRDVMNDEWMTNAIVLPATLEQTAMEAYHVCCDSACT